MAPTLMKALALSASAGFALRRLRMAPQPESVLDLRGTSLKLPRSSPLRDVRED